MTTKELAAELGVSIAIVKKIFQDARPDQVIEYRGWRLMRHSDPSPKGSRTPIHHYETLSYQKPQNTKDDQWQPLSEIVEETGLHRSLFSPNSFRSGSLTRNGWVIEREREPGQSHYRYRIVERGTKVTEQRPKETACHVCNTDLTPRRTVTINGLSHCVPCNRAAFVDGCPDTRRSLGI